MATIAGLVSGGAGLVSLSLQLMETAVKLKALAKAYKHVPQTLQNLAFEIETFGLVLHEIERDRQAHDSPASDLLARCILLCEQSVERICTATARLEKMIGRIRFLGRLMTALEEKETLQIFQELERAKSTLSLAHDMYLESKRRHDSRTSLATSGEIRGILVQQQSTIQSQSRDIQQLRDGMVILTATISNKPSHHATENVAGTVNRKQALTSLSSATSRPNRSIRSSNKQKPRVLKVNAWFLSKIWQISLDRTPAGWDLSLRTWNVVPESAPVFDLCWKGDLLGKQKLINDGKASYYDVDEDGGTLLSAAMRRPDADIIQHLLEFTESWAVMKGVNTRPDFDNASSKGGAIYSLLFGDPRLDLSDLTVDEPGSTHNVLLHCSGTDSLTAILSNLSEPWESRPLAKRVDFAMRLSPFCAYSTFRLALGPCSLEDITDLREDGLATSVFHFAAESCLHQDHMDRDWADMIVELIKLGCDPYAKNAFGETPLNCALDACLTPRGNLESFERWLRLVCEAGVSLVTFERKIEEELATGRETKVSMLRGRTFVIDQALSGPNICDWDFIGHLYRTVPIWSPLEMPGQSERYSDICPVLPWEPTQDDECVLSNDILSLSIWQEEDLKIFSAPVSLRSLVLQEDNLNCEIRFAMYDRCKDDLELNYVLQEHWRGDVRERKRSRSQSPDLRSSCELDVRDQHTWWREKDPSDLRWHKCRLDSRWRLQDPILVILGGDGRCMAGCPLDLSQLENERFQGLQWAARRYKEGVEDYWNPLYYNGEDENGLAVRWKRPRW